MRVRVRGIYSTAITKILLDAGMKVTHSSKKIRERFSLEDSKEPPTVTVKDTEQKHGIVIVGDFEDGRKVYEIVKEALGDCFCFLSKLPLHAIVKGKVVEVRDGKSIVDLGSYRGVLNGELEEGSEVLVDIARPFFPVEEYAKLSANLTVYGNFVALIKGIGKKVVFSRHITSKNLKSNLLKIASLTNLEDWCVKWRSSATIGELGEMLKDLQETFRKAEDVVKRGEKAEVGEVVYEGEFFAILLFDRKVKRKLDEVRNEVLPTIKNHHSLKSMGESEAVDLAECILSAGAGEREKISEVVYDYVSSLMREQSSIAIEHVSLLTGELKRLTPGKLVDFRDGVYTLKRVFRSRGVFDGINVEKEPGDYDLMQFSVELPFVLHRYFSKEGEFKGIYVNLNTPPEISRNAVRYVDVEIDVVASGERIEVIDRDRLEKACELGIISESSKEHYEKLAGEVERFVSSFDDISALTLNDLKKVIHG